MLGRLRRFAKDRRGATAVEFALVVSPFLLLMFAVFEYIMIYLVMVTLDSATAEAARKIRTGEAQKAAMTSADFKSLVCKQMGWLSNQCSSQLYVDARVFGDFASGTSPTPISGGKFDSSQLKFSTGGPGNIILVSTFYKWNLLTPALEASFATLGGNMDVISARAVFRNEPYS